MHAQPTAVFDTSEQTFAQDVVAASQDATILVDFHADWCGPCKVLGPILEKLADESGGLLRLAKVDTEKERRLAAAFRVQSIPFVVAFQDGQPVDAFVGQKDEKGVLDFLKELGVELQTTAANDAPLDTALGKCEALLRGRRFDEVDRVVDLLESIEEDDADFVAAERLLAAMPYFRATFPSEGEAAAAMRQSLELYRAGDEVAAMEALIESVSADRGFADELARKALVALMQLHAEHGPRIDAMRRRLAVLLY